MVAEVAMRAEVEVVDAEVADGAADSVETAGVVTGAAARVSEEVASGVAALGAWSEKQLDHEEAIDSDAEKEEAERKEGEMGEMGHTRQAR